MAKNKFTLINSIPPIMPIDWQSWESSPLIQNMSDVQIGIALKIMLKQWVLGSLPHNAYRMATILQSRYETVLKFLQTYPKFVVCAEHGCSWDDVGMECDCTADVATVVCQKTKNFFIDANSGLPLGTTEPNRTYMEQKETQHSQVLEEEVSPVPRPQSKPPVLEAEENDVEVGSDEAETAPIEESAFDADEVAHAFMDMFKLPMKKRMFWNWDRARATFTELLKRHPQDEVLRVIKGAAANEFYKHGARSINPDKQRPWDWFAEKYDDIKDKLASDEEFTRESRKKARAAASGHAAINPELHTGLDASGKSWTEGKVKVSDLVRGQE